ncbi:MAG: transposase, partial [Chloroflexota bacterium]
MSKKAIYRPRNWKAYNQSLVQRGSLTVWIEEDVIAKWHPEPEGKRKRGGQVQYSDQAIETLLMLRAVYQLPYRQTVGFAQSILDLMGVDVKAPDYTLLCKRGATVAVDLDATGSDDAKH